jgi:hypothetical protein
MVVDRIGYPHFFLYTASLAVPGLLMLYLLHRQGAFEPARGSGRASAAAGT